MGLVRNSLPHLYKNNMLDFLEIQINVLVNFYMIVDTDNNKILYYENDSFKVVNSDEIKYTISVGYEYATGKSLHFNHLYFDNLNEVVSHIVKHYNITEEILLNEYFEDFKKYYNTKTIS